MGESGAEPSGEASTRSDMQLTSDTEDELPDTCTLIFHFLTSFLLPPPPPLLSLYF